MLRRLGVGPTDAVAYILPNGLEAPVALLAGATAGIVNPINPMLNAETIAGILRDVDAKVVISLAPFPKTDVAQKVGEALEHAPSVEHLIQVDLKPYLGFGLSLAVPFIRPKVAVRHKAEIHDWHAATRRENAERLDFADDRTTASAPISIPAAPPACPRSSSTGRAASSTTAGAARPTSSPRRTC